MTVSQSSWTADWTTPGSPTYTSMAYVDVRHRGRVVSQADIVATGVSIEGRREILGMSVGDAETIDFWTQFLRGLRERGLKVASLDDPEGVSLVISDAHSPGSRPR